MNRETGRRDGRRVAPSGSSLRSAGASTRQEGASAEQSVDSIRRTEGRQPASALRSNSATIRRIRSGGAFGRWWSYQWRKNRGAMTALCVAAAMLLVVVGVATWWNLWAVAPDIPPVGENSGGESGIGGSQGGSQSGQAGNSGDSTDPEGNDQFSGLTEMNVAEEIPDYIANQKEGVYTFLVIGRTRMDDNADLLMLVIFDSNTGEIDACNVPRDTMINIRQDIKRINASIFGGIGNVKSWVRKTTGVQPNFYVMVDWQAVGDLVNAVGGIYYEVPFRMFYIDGTKDVGFTIDLEPGYQLLDGDKAMQLLRWRRNKYPEDQKAAVAAGFDGSDTKRAEMQQAFIVEAARQILQLKNAKYIGAMAQAFIDNVETDLKVGNLAWFAQQALTKDSAHKVQFHTLPGNYINSCYSRNYRNFQSYVTFYPSQLLDMVNQHMNPYSSPITMEGLDLMQINSDGTISSTTGTLADQEHNPAVKVYWDVQKGLAYYDPNGKPIYYKTPPDGSGETGTGDDDQSGDITGGETDDPDGDGQGGDVTGGEADTQSGEQTGGQSGGQSGSQAGEEPGIGGGMDIGELPVEPPVTAEPEEPDVESILNAA